MGGPAGRASARRARPDSRGQAHGRPQQRGRAREPLAVLGGHVARTAAASRRARSPSAIDDTFGGLDELKGPSTTRGVKRFGSGWAWLVWDGTGLAVYSTPNQDSPKLKDWDDVPLLGIDVWEHAYYLKYQNRRPEYLGAWWNVVNWDAVQQRFDAAKSAERGTDGSEGLSLGPVPRSAQLRIVALLAAR